MKCILLFLLSFNIFAGGVIPERDSLGNIVTVTNPFSSKSNYFFRGRGVSCSVAATSTTSCEYAISYAHVKYTGVQILNGTIGDKANFKILDTITGTYSTIPNYLLNQFGFNWYLTGDTKEILSYPADLYIGMRVVVEFINSGAAKTIYINHFIHEQQ